MWNVAAWLGNAASALSIALLVRQGLSAGWAAPLQIIVDYYRSIIEFLFGWAYPFVAPAAVGLAHAVYPNVGARVLSPDWKHVYVAFAVPAAAVWRVMLGPNSEFSQLNARSDRFLGRLDAYAASYLGLAFILLVLVFFASELSLVDESQSDRDIGLGIIAGAMAFSIYCALMIPTGGWIMSILNGDAEGERDAKRLIRPIALNLFAIIGGSLAFLILNAGLQLAGL